MKQIYFLSLVIFLFSACKKDDSGSGGVVIGGTGNNGAGVTTGNTTTYNGYVVKSIGVSRIILGIDANDKLTVAQIYGGGNKVVLKPGTGNTVEMIGTGAYSMMPDGFGPDGSVPAIDALIDNGTMPSDTSGSKLCIKIKGFDKSKTGYNQLNLVMYKMVRATPPGTAGFFNNVAYITFDYNKKQSEYSGAFFKGLFTGNINVADVQMAAPLSSKPYITEDQVIYAGQAGYSPIQGQTTSMKMNSNTFQFDLSTQANFNYPLGTSFKYQWVNADNGSVTRDDDYDFRLYFPNIKSGDDVVLPSDTSSKVFLRVTGFDPAVTGFNQLRLFIGKSGTLYDGGLPFIMGTKQTSTPTLAAAKSYFIPNKLVVNNAAPYVPHY